MSNQRPGLTELKNPIYFLALGFGSGCSPKAPGTLGTLVGVIIYLGLQVIAINNYFYIGIVVLMFILGIWLCDRTARQFGVHDHQAIVWDEIVGYLVTMIMVPYQWMWIVAGFILFRLFDILKPWPVSWADKAVRNGFGIMLDDLIAAIYALLVLQITLYLL